MASNTNGEYQNQNCDQARLIGPIISDIFPSSHIAKTSCIKSHNEAFEELKSLLMQYQLNENTVCFIAEAYNKFLKYVLHSISNEHDEFQQSRGREEVMLFHRHITLITMLMNQELQKVTSFLYTLEWTVITKAAVLEWLYSNENYKCQNHGTGTCTKLKVNCRL